MIQKDTKEKDIMMKGILNITLETAYECYKEKGIGFCIKDGKLKGFYKNV